MDTYIRGMGIISPQATTNRSLFLEDPINYSGNFLTVVDPGYKNYIDPKLSRRMSKIIKMGVSAAKICLDDSGIAMPDAIITGTGLGCMEDTEFFLSEIIQNQEKLLTPTAFIQSTHNTVAAQIALMIKCHAENFTYVHRGFSFELALQDAMMYLKEQTAENILVGGLDELTQNTFAILKRLKVIKPDDINSLSLYKSKGAGTVYGEGAGFFMLSSQKSSNDYARLQSMGMMLNPSQPSGCEDLVEKVIHDAGLTIDDIDIVIGGMNGDQTGDLVYDKLKKGILSKCIWVGFKHLCGEYHTATAFAMWLAARMLKDQRIPYAVNQIQDVKRSFRTILVYNHYLQVNHTAFILQAC